MTFATFEKRRLLYELEHPDPGLPASYSKRRATHHLLVIYLSSNCLFCDLQSSSISRPFSYHHYQLNIHIPPRFKSRHHGSVWSKKLVIIPLLHHATTRAENPHLVSHTHSPHNRHIRIQQEPHTFPRAKSLEG